MNWSTFQTYNDSPERAFEILCNQLFENWNKREYNNKLATFSVVNGSGGDGGVESYSTLTNGEIVGLQAKWFRYSISNSQIQQIKNSIETAVKIRPQISRYIVCIPRDLASDTGRGSHTEAKRWETLLEDIRSKYPGLSVELWNETRIVKELQEDTSNGIKKYWFENSEISEDSFEFAFEKSKGSWLKTKYIPELNTCGDIDSYISLTLGEVNKRENLANTSLNVLALCEQLDKAIPAFQEVLKNKDTELNNELETILSKARLFGNACRTIHDWCIQESVSVCDIDKNVFSFNFEDSCEIIDKSHEAGHCYFRLSEVTKILHKLSLIDIYQLFYEFNTSLCTNPVLFLGEPGTGKTHGVAASSEKLFANGIHIPLVIPARNISPSWNWKDIISSALGLSSNWSEDEIWQAMLSMINRHCFSSIYTKSHIKIIPKIVLIVDGIDESAPYEVWKDRIKEAGVITNSYQQIRFYFTSRPFVFSEELSGVTTRRLSAAGDVPTHILFERYVEAYNITIQNYGWLKFALTTPLSLKIFCELNKGKTIEYTKNADVSLTNLMRKKIELIEKEFAKEEKTTIKNQYIFRAVLILSDLFLKAKSVEYNEAVSNLSNTFDTSQQHCKRMLQCLENYGILSSFCKHGEGLSPDLYFYMPGIQGYFDYAMALKLMKTYDHPQNIDFKQYSEIETEALYGLSVMAMQNYDYLITRNKSIDNAIDEWFKQDLQFFALRHTSFENGALFKEYLLEIMAENADGLMTVTNNLILPLCRNIDHPLGVKLLDEFLFSFELPAQRDLLWSVPGFLNASDEYKWHTWQTLDLDEEAYALTKYDSFNGCPSVYVWSLSTVNNTLRRERRSNLMRWAKQNPSGFYDLFLKFSTINDPQIKSDLFSILVCLVYDGADSAIVKRASDWMMENILHPTKVYGIMDVSIRYYAIAIVNKAVLLGLYSRNDVLLYMPPYKSDNYAIALNKKALAGTRMSGHSAIDYDLARYVLIDHFESVFSQYGHSDGDQIDNLISEVSKTQPEFTNINSEQFIISAAFAYLLQMGWNEDEFYNLKPKEQDNGTIDGLDVAILRRYAATTHGLKSPIMTVCEKYVWQFRNYMSGFLADRLLYWSNNEPESISDYGLLDDFSIPIQDIEQIDPNDLPESNPWYIPEPKSVIIDAEVCNKEDVINSVICAPNLNWEKWITIHNVDKQYSINSDSLLALSNYSCFYGSAGVETNIFISTIVIDNDDIDTFIDKLNGDKALSKRISNPSDWRGVVNSSCYITPKEACWFPWKKRYNSSCTEEFPEFSIQSAVDECCYNFPEYGDVYYDIPSAPIRKLLQITDTNGYIFYDDNKNIKAQYSVSGEKWRTAQNYLLVDKKELLDALQNCGKALLWILREYRREDGKASERYEEFYAEKDCSYIGFFKGGEFVIKQIDSRISHSPIPQTKEEDS